MRKLTALLLLVCVAMSLAAPVSAAGPLEYTIDAPDDPDYGDPTSVEVTHTAGGGATKNEDVSKNAALIPPAFGSATSYLPGSGEHLTPNLAPAAAVGTGAIVNGTGGNIIFPPSNGVIVSAPSSGPATAISIGYTEATSDLFYPDGSLGTLAIPAIGLTVKIYEGTGSAALAKGAGHFEETSIWGSNVALAAHNRGVSSYFGEIHTLNIGDTITLTTRLGTRTYEVTSVSKVSETDRSGLAPSTEGILTLYTCVRDQRELRWCVVADAIV